MSLRVPNLGRMQQHYGIPDPKSSGLQQLRLSSDNPNQVQGWQLSFQFGPYKRCIRTFKQGTAVIETATDADVSSITFSNQPRGNEVKASTLVGRTLDNLGLRHGDLVFVSYQSQPSGSQPAVQATSQETPSASKETGNRIWEQVTEDPVDVYWRSQPGKLPRGRDARFCKHGPNGMCDYCMPLEPYDAAYHKEHAIKHLSYHAYLRKITPKPSASAAASLPPLSPLSYKVKSPCPTGNHPPWPAGICTSCQPSAITLQSQPFRMVDHLEIASTDIIDRFLQAWRKTGLQRFGWLIGHYEPYDKVPMGVKAVVEAICESPQQGELDGLTLGLPWEDEQRIREISAAASTPLTIVGYVFTDLDPTPDDRTKNVYKRHAQSFYLSSLEAIFAATLQKQNPVPSRSSPTGQFSSRLVTAVLTATEDGAVDFAAYQVSEQAVAMVEADMIEASVEPGIVRVKEEDRSQDSARYVPDVFFSYKNDYGLEVKKSAKPCFPVEYLIVNVTHGFPQNPSPLFRSTQFAIENRPGLEDQHIETVLSDLRRLDAFSIEPSTVSQTKDNNKRVELAKWLSDWHLITFLAHIQLLSPDDSKLIMRVASSPNLLEDTTQLDPVLASDGWQTLLTIARENAPAYPTSSHPALGGTDIPMDTDMDAIDFPPEEPALGDSGARIRICPHCTYENTHSRSDCDMCMLPLDG
ncbi:hypothetical protein AX16_005527 [Volvariella volvacea WC 439]|nr:hypothetical protein AX16_005527 [Volvariella volvacea WC 439]